MFQYNNTLDAVALVPGPDMLNVAKVSELNTGWSSASAELFSLRSGAEVVASGHELFESYCRQCDNIDLLKSWGVYLEDNPNSIAQNTVDCKGPAGITMQRAT